MTSGSNPERTMVSLNEVINLLGALNTGQLTQALRGADPLRACDINCDCNTTYCRCHGGVYAVARESMMGVSDYLRLREQRLTDLRQQLQLLEGGGEEVARLQAQAGTQERK